MGKHQIHCVGVEVITYIEQCDRGQNLDLIQKYHKLRKKVFCDHYGWVPPNPDGTETDHLDDAYNVLVLYLDSETGEVLGGVRLLPTTGQTLLHTVWKDMLPDPEDFRSPNIWEATRFCVDIRSDASRNRNFVNKITLALLVAVLDFARLNGISHMIAVCEQKFFDMCSTYNGAAELISQKQDENGCAIACGLWATDEALQSTLKWVRPFIAGITPITIKAA